MTLAKSSELFCCARWRSPFWRGRRQSAHHHAPPSHHRHRHAAHIARRPLRPTMHHSDTTAAGISRTANALARRRVTPCSRRADVRPAPARAVAFGLAARRLYRQLAGRRGAPIYRHQPDRARQPVVRRLHGHGAQAHRPCRRRQSCHRAMRTTARALSGPQVGAIAVMGRHGGGHVGVVSGIDAERQPDHRFRQSQPDGRGIGLSARPHHRLRDAGRLIRSLAASR